MRKNYLITALRNIRRNAFHLALNTGGMAIGMACAILILLWVFDEWSYDRQFSKADRLYRVISNEDPADPNSAKMIPVPGALKQVLTDQFPEIIQSTRFLPSTPLTLKKGDEFMEESVTLVDPAFLQMFDVAFVEGDIRHALDDPHSIILTEESARKYFGQEPALGKTIPSRGYDVTVSGVVKAFPKNCHLQFNFLVPIQWLTELGAGINDWRERFPVYIEMKEGADVPAFENKLKDIIQKNQKDAHSVLFLQNVKRIHLYSSGKYTYDIGGLGDILYVRIFFFVAVFILALACFNFINLSTAQAAGRVKETGVRKMAGASRSGIIFQFFGESVATVFVAHIIAMILVEIMLPFYNNLTGKHLLLNYQSAGLYAGLLLIILCCGLLSGSYPALYLSGVSPALSLKGMIRHSAGKAGLRRTLVVFQFTISLLLLICTWIIGSQIRYMQTEKPGFNRENMVYFMFPTRPGDPRLESLKKELGSVPGITGITKGVSPVNIEGSVDGFSWRDKKPGANASFCMIGADADYAAVFQFELEEGRMLSPDNPTDSSAIVINQKAAEVIGFAHPVGESLTTPWGAHLQIVGVLKDFHFRSFRYSIEPLIVSLGASNQFYVRLKPDHLRETITSIQKMYQSFNPGLPFEYHFLEADFNNLYRAEQRISSLSGIFTLLAIVISCLGLIGLSAFMTESRTKEIGIRKTNGARPREIFYLLSKEYLVLTLIGWMIALPLAWFGMHAWLRNFAFHIRLDWKIFVVTALFGILITLLTVGIQSYRAAMKNPVDALRYE